MEIKKVIAAVLSAAMLVGTGVCSFADTTGTTQTVSGIDGELITNQIQITSNGGDRIKSGYTLSVSDLNNSGVCANKKSIVFYASSDNANWTETVSADTYTITNDMANKQICAVLTDNSNVKYISNTVTVGENLKQRLGYDGKAPNIVENAPDSNKFILTDGMNTTKELTLLETREDKAFVLSPKTSTFPFYEDSTAQFQIIDTKDPKSIFYKINQSDYITQNILPKSMQSYLIETGWETEAGCQTLDEDHSNMINDTVVFSKIAVPSQSEFYDNADKIGYKDATGLILRSPYTKDGRIQAVNPIGGGIAVVNTYSSTYYSTRPCFYINTDIFKNIKVESAGIEVVKTILSLGNENGLYTDAEWQEFQNRANALQFGEINGTEAVKLNITSNGGDRIKSGYTLTAANKDDTEDITGAAQKIAYFVSDSGEQGTWEMAGTAENGAKFTLLNSHANKYVIAAAKMEDGTKYISNQLTVGENLAASPGVWGKIPEITEGENNYVMKAYADKTDRLYLDIDGYNGIGYTMLDADENNVLLLSDSTDQKATYLDPENPTVKYQIYDSADPNSVAYYINQKSFINNNIVPSGYEDYINTTAWETETGCRDKMVNDTVDISKVALPSMTELYKYIDKIGYRDGYSIRTRTPASSESSAGYFKFLLPSGGMQYVEPTSTFYQFRVETSINKNLYKHIKLDAINSGVDALAAVGFPGLLSIGEAKALGYSDDELIKLGYFDNKIYAALTNISVSGNDVLIDVATSNPKENIDAKIICAVYDSDNRLKFIKSDDVSIAHGEKNIEKTITLSDGIGSTDKVAFYLWKDETNISPISAKIFGAEKNTVPIATVTSLTEIPYNNSIFEYNGRWKEDAANGYMIGNWAYPYVDFSVKATSLVLNFGDATPKAIKIYVNDKEVWADAQSSASKTAAIDISEYLANGVSNVRVFDNAETLPMNFKGITVNEGAEVLNPKQSRGNMLFIGDSISSASYSYTYTLPLALGMDNTRISKSGIAFLDGNYAGAVRDGVLGMQTKFKQMQTLDKGTDAYDFANDDKFDFIFVNIGTNDVYKSSDGSVDNIDRFKTEYKEFINFLSSTYTKAKIVVIKPVRKSKYWAYDETNKTNAYWRAQTFDSIGEAIGRGEYGENVLYVDTTEWDIDINDIDNIHPTVSGHEQIKSKLIGFMTENNLI
mgnify:CR=1 FL=1